MANNDYIDRLKQVIFHLRGGDSRHTESVPVHEVFRGETAWKGDVEVFDLVSHAKAKRCDGWKYGDPEEFISNLELPPVDSAQNAVKVGVAYPIKNAMK